MPITSIQRGPEDSVPYSAGMVIFRDGDRADQMFIVVEGEVEIRYGDRVLEVIGPGGILGEMSLIDSSARSADAYARTNCLLAGINRAKFISLVEKTPAFALEVMGLMAERLRRQTGTGG
jgi:CRP/FNR family transcriptional regulator, cyclic AMP receptor protein